MERIYIYMKYGIDIYIYMDNPIIYTMEYVDILKDKIFE